MQHLPLGQMLMQQGRLDEFQLRSALAHQRRWGGRIGEAIAALGFLREREVLETVARQLEVPLFEIGERCIPQPVLRLVPERLIRVRQVFPLAVASESRRGPLALAMTDPRNLEAIDEVRFASGLAVKPVLVAVHDLEYAIERHFGTLAPGAGASAVELPSDALGPMRVVPFAHRLH
jgi:type IV pilus assembly protein PilB